jgi:hypothetical protein
MCLCTVLVFAACGDKDGGGDSVGEVVCGEAAECPEGENEYTVSDTPCGDDDGGCLEVTACGETIYCRPTGV